MDRLSLDEILDWQGFQDLVADYFRSVKQDKEFNVDEVTVQPTGRGSDGGRDILVTLNINDSIQSFQRIWVVQCKFHNSDINMSLLADHNIPTLLHQYGAHGYLLVCKNNVTAPLSEMFEDLNKKCVHKRSYDIWTGNMLLQRILLKTNLIDHYFPKYAMFLKQAQANANRFNETSSNQ